FWYEFRYQDALKEQHVLPMFAVTSIEIAFLETRVKNFCGNFALLE
ncbi:7144_t:CDS:1, partial [Ambispora leptoticha]